MPFLSVNFLFWPDFSRQIRMLGKDLQWLWDCRVLGLCFGVLKFQVYQTLGLLIFGDVEF